MNLASLYEQSQELTEMLEYLQQLEENLVTWEEDLDSFSFENIPKKKADHLFTALQKFNQANKDVKGVVQKRLREVEDVLYN